METIAKIDFGIKYSADIIKEKCKEKCKMKETPLDKFLRKFAFFEAGVIIVLFVIVFFTKDIFLIKALFVLGIITAFFGISLLFLQHMGILKTNPVRDLASAYLLLSICCALIIAVSGVPSIEATVNSFNKSIESLEDLPDFMETQTKQMNKSIETLEEVHDFLITPTPETE